MIIEGKHSIWLAGPARFIEQDKDMAWAERSVRPNPTFKWVLGRYVEADRANSNGQFWTQQSLRESMWTIQDSPLNIAHYPKRIVGHYVDAELMHPTGETATEEHPFVEALGVLYKHYFPEETDILERAHAEGQLYFSMECVAKSVTCGGENGCGKEFAYEGPQSASYCEHINERASYRQFNNPLFLAGALLVPPMVPGWKDAHISDMGAVMKQFADQMEAAYDGASADLPDQDPRVWEALMLRVMDLAATRS